MLYNEATLNANVDLTAADLIKPVLLVLAHAERAKVAPFTSAHLRQALRPSVALSENDQAQTASDRLSRFDRKVLNLISHNTLVNQGLVKYARSPAQGKNSTLRLTAKGKTELAKACLPLLGDVPEPSKNLEINPEAKRSLEGDLTFTAILVLAQLQAKAEPGAWIPMADLRPRIKASLSHVSPADLEPLKGRSDSKIDQVIRNLISNDTLLNKGLIRRNTTGLQVTSAGYEHVLNEFLAFLPSPDFGALAPSQEEPVRRRAMRA